MRFIVTNSLRRSHPSICAPVLLSVAFAAFPFSCPTCLAQGSAQRPPQSRLNHAGTGTQAKVTPSAHLPFNYDQTVQRAKAMVSVRPQEALRLCKELIQKDSSRYEAHVIAAAALRQQEQYRQALVHLQTAFGLAPRDETPRILVAITEIKVASRPDAHRQLEVLHSVIQDADRAHSQDERCGFLHEFLDKSRPFVNDYPDYAQIWLLRGVAALECEWKDYSRDGREAAFQLMRLNQGNNGNEESRRLLADMDRKGWAYDMTLEVEPQVMAINNSLRAMGTVTGTSSDHDGNEFSFESVRFSYGDLRGSCSTGFDLETQITSEEQDHWSGQSDPDVWTYTQTGTFHFDIANPEFISFVSAQGSNSLADRNLSFVHSAPYAIRNKQKHMVVNKSGDSKSEDSEPRDSDFNIGSLVTQRPHEAKGLAELLNRLHWACLLQSNSRDGGSPLR